MKKPTISQNNLPFASDFLLYQTEDGQTRIEVRLQDESVWLTQLTLAELFLTSKQNISLHLKNIFAEGELAENRVIKEYLTTAADGKQYRTKYYNLEAVIAVGYRVKSHRGTQFQTQKHARGSAQAELYPNDIDKFVVPILPFELQTTIGNLVRESLVKQRESDQLLQQAKNRVEQLIEAAVSS